MIQQFIAKLSDKEKKIFYIAVPIVLLALYDWLLIGPALNKLAILDEEIAQQEKIVKADLRYLNYKDQIVKEDNLYSKYISAKQLDGKEINRNFLSAVERIAGETKVNINKSNTTDSKAENGYTKYYANVDCAGTMEDMVSFMHAINSTDDLLTIESFKLTPKRGEEGSANASLTIAKLFVSAQDQDQTPADKP